MYFKDKPKVFVRFFPGASGNLFSVLLHNLVRQVGIINDYSGHINSADVYAGHNFQEGTFMGSSIKNTPEQLQLFRTRVEGYDKATSPDVDLTEAVGYLLKNFKFSPTPNDIYTIPNHVVNPKPLLVAFKPSRYNTKLINIRSTDNDREQICYNTVTKQVIANRKDFVLHSILEYFRKTYPEKADRPKFNPSTIDYTDERFIYYLCKFNSERSDNLFDRFNNFELGDGYDYLDVPFSSINDMSLVYRLDEIAEYIGLDATDIRKDEIVKMLAKYSAAQKENPYKDLHIDDY